MTRLGGEFGSKVYIPAEEKERIGDELESLFSLQAKTLSWVRRLDPDLYDPKPSTLRERDNPALLLDPAVYECPEAASDIFYVGRVAIRPCCLLC